MGGVEAQGIQGLVPIHWWVRLGPGASASQLMGRAGSWGLWLQGPMVPGAGVLLLVGEVEA